MTVQFLSGLAFTLVSLIWFVVVIYICKHRYGKDAEIHQIIGCLIVAGPMGWVTIVIIAAYDLVDKLYMRFNKDEQ